MLRLGPLGEERPTGGGSNRLSLAALAGAPVAEKKERQNQSGNEPCEKSVHRLPGHNAHESQACGDDNVHDGEDGECVAERAWITCQR